MKLRYDDDQHYYWLDGKRCKSVTTVAKIPEDLYRLQQWEKRQVAIGLASDPDLIEAVAAHVDDDDILNGLCEKAKEKAGANRASRRGTAGHRVTERHDAGQDIIPTPMATDIVAGWGQVLAAAGLEIIPELMERIVVFPDQRICGKFDRIARTRKGRLVMLDLKTGERAIKYPHAIAVQLALYANAPMMAGTLNWKGETEEFEPLPELDRKWGVVIHLPENGPAQAVKIDIEAGWETAKEICFPTIRWRSKRQNDLVFPLAMVEPVKWQPDEGDDLTEDDVAALRDEFKECPDRAAVDAWIKQSVDAQRSFNLAGPGCRATVRRFEIIRAAIAWSAHPEDVVRAALGVALGEELQPSMTVGMALGSLTTDQAKRLNVLAHQLDEGDQVLTFADDGTPRIGSKPRLTPVA